ncbi:hypothetical protein CLV59_11354 [Chitinophaga dinghuensis]|uniref:Uncharacterized protein n=1 Tax=Chitinophaga dinghuensis TaxID=1539050 RepID=A0A327VKY8_9BACT|nr:hypothetical protein [Chitinophaga dinghuensis]RAJ73501.1 hypothetical protein CLV59_11354 [Chitinophaga dinghuensis]
MKVEATPGNRIKWSAYRIFIFLFIILIYNTPIIHGYQLHLIIGAGAVMLLWSIFRQREEAVIISDQHLEIITCNALNRKITKGYDLRDIKYNLSKERNLREREADQSDPEQKLYLYYKERFIVKIDSRKNGWNKYKIDKMVDGLKEAGVPLQYNPS